MTRKNVLKNKIVDFMVQNRRTFGLASVTMDVFHKDLFTKAGDYTPDGKELCQFITETDGTLPYIIARRAVREWVKANYGQSEAENPSWDIDALADYVVDKIKE